jgi:hypothetical protein
MRSAFSVQRLALLALVVFVAFMASVASMASRVAYFVGRVRLSVDIFSVANP